MPLSVCKVLRRDSEHHAMKIRRGFEDGDIWSVSYAQGKSDWYSLAKGGWGIPRHTLPDIEPQLSVHSQ
jgi:hypothetical protein